MQNLSAYIIIGYLIISTFSTLSTQMFEFYYSERNCFTTEVESIASIHYSFNLHIFLHHKHKKMDFPSIAIFVPFVYIYIISLRLFPAWLTE